MAEEVVGQASAELFEVLRRLDDLLGRCSPEEVDVALDRVMAREDLHALTLTGVTAIRSRVHNLELTHAILDAEPGRSPELSPLRFPLGTRSPDGSAMLGREGHLYVVGGSNNVLAQYAWDPETARALAQQWMGLFIQRTSMARMGGYAYLQLIVPEKISAIPGCFPQAPSVPTPLLREVEGRVARFPAVSRVHVPALDLFQRAGDARTLYKMTDSHLAPAGTYLLFRELVRRTAGSEPPDLSFRLPRAEIGDLSFRMTGSFAASVHHEIAEAELPPYVRAPLKVGDVDPGPGRHLGRSQSWRNPDAPIQKTVLAFGNSFFSLVENGQSSLSWWFARWFRDFHFVWTNDVDAKLIEALKPDIVVWQGTERFLPVLSRS